LAGVPGAEAAASTLVDLTTEAVAQLAFIALDLLALEDIRPGAAIVRPAFIGLAAFSLGRSQWLSRLVRGGAKRWLTAFGEVDNALPH
jgi:glycosyltransferase 2 family protein